MSQIKIVNLQKSFGDFTAVKNSTAVIAHTRSILESESQFRSDADALGSYSHLQDIHSGRLLGTLSIKSLHIDGLHDAVAEIDKKNTYQELQLLPKELLK